MAAIVMTLNTAVQMLINHAAEILVSDIILHETEAWLPVAGHPALYRPSVGVIRAFGGSESTPNQFGTNPESVRPARRSPAGGLVPG